MPLSMHQASAPVFIRALQGLSTVLRKAAAHAEAKGFDPVALLQARLYPDMFPLTRQVQICTDFAKGAVARLAGVTEFERTAELLPLANLIRLVIPSAVAHGENAKTLTSKNIKTINLIFRILLSSYFKIILFSISEKRLNKFPDS